MKKMESRKQAYPTFIVDTKDGSEHPFLVCVPDMEIYTEGSSLADAIEMARDAIGVTGISMEDHEETIPEPSTFDECVRMVKENADEIDFSLGTMTYVDVNFTEYRRKADQKTVRRNVALPAWLDYEAERAGINVSRVLQEALMNVLHVQRRTE